MIQELTSSLTQITELCRCNLSQTICADCVASKVHVTLSSLALPEEAAELHVAKNIELIWCIAYFFYQKVSNAKKESY